MSAKMPTRREVYELGLTAMKSGVASTQELERFISLGVAAEHRVPLAVAALDMGDENAARMLLQFVPAPRKVASA